jgi:hypothetical protein
MAARCSAYFAEGGKVNGLVNWPTAFYFVLFTFSLNA